MKRTWLIAGGAALAVALIGLGIAWFWTAPADNVAVKPAGTSALDEAQVPSNIVTVDLPADMDPSRGATPMAKRVAVVGLLNKRNGVSRDLTMKPGEAVRVGDVVVRLRACEQTAPWEQEHYTGAFVQVDVEQLDKSWRRVFSGWLYKERPSLNVVQHPIYDVWTKSCAMTFPGGGGETVLSTAGSRSSAKKSPDAPASAPADPAPSAPSSPPTTPPIAADNNPT